MSLNPQSCRTPRWRWVLAWLGLVTLAIALSMAEMYSSKAVTDKPVSLSLAFRRSVEEWAFWGVLSLGVWWLARRYPLESTRLSRWMGLHIGGSIVATVAHAFGYAWLLDGQMSIEGTMFVFPVILRKILIFHSVFSLLIYWLIVLAHHGGHYYRRFKERERQAAELQAQLVQARLDALRMQINPHFLFNTLHTISAMIHEKPEVADRMLVRLSELLRLTLDRNDAQEVPLAQELGFLERYLEIERARFESRLHVEFAVEPETRVALVPWLILQPLVENAIHHGIELREEGGRVTIRASRNNGQLELRVADNGCGVPEAQPAALREGIGLGNTRSRLAHLYGAEQRFELTNETGDGGGFEVRLTIPFRAATETQIQRNGH